MNKNLLSPLLKLRILFAMFSLVTAQAGFSQDCKTQAANKPSTSVRFSDYYVNISSSETKPASWNITRIKPTLVKAESWVKNLLTGFKGAKLAYSNDYFLEYVYDRKSQEFYKSTGIKGYYKGVMRFYAYYCYDKKTEVYTEDECGSFIYVYFNNVLATGLCADGGVFTVNGKPIFRTFAKSHSEGRIDYYEQVAMSDVSDTIYKSKNEYILLRNSDQPVFIPVTRKEYLEQMLKEIDVHEISDPKKDEEMYNNNIKQFEDEMRVYKATDKTYTPEKEAKRRKWFEEDQAKVKKRMEKDKYNIVASRETVLQYLNKNAEWLKRGLRLFYSYSYTANGIRAYFDDLDKPVSGDETQYEVVSLNPAYYNSAAGTDAAQLIVVELQKGTYPHMLKVASLVKQPGALAPLQAILKPR
ncbi:MAG: hypothetical protein JWR61_2863 [Ferruginibacter sp.]|uniref:hypothetical protein n=1 Tax=Ferruginibacter sp. TaxID=1940288 RepID=UPI00265B64A4|nr:hypothetical protein [Ferruginibacter sp.]MDB5277908.1 hypothetical protein [Ferruginibacter sp.]